MLGGAGLGDGGNSIGLGGGDATTGSGDGCQHLTVQFLPRIPVVYVLADQSGSMFASINAPDGGRTTEWDALRDATIPVIQSLQAQVAFGFAAYTGINPSTKAGSCPLLTTVPVALNNGQAIASTYTAIQPPTFKAETPAQLSLEAISQTLMQLPPIDAGTGTLGAKYILWVTDGETDFCDDPAPVCPADADIAELQKLNKEGIQTLMLGLASAQSNIAGDVLQDFANAGAGVPTYAPPSNPGGAPLTPTDIYYQCSGVNGWKALAAAANLPPMQALGTYAVPDASVTNAKLFRPNPADVTDLTNQISAALKTVKSCSFDLQGQIMVNVANAAEGRVSIDSVAIAYTTRAGGDGWTMTSPTQLELVGSACDTWRATGMNINFDFPCDIVIPIPR